MAGLGLGWACRAGQYIAVQCNAGQGWTMLGLAGVGGLDWLPVEVWLIQVHCIKLH